MSEKKARIINLSPQADKPNTILEELNAALTGDAGLRLIPYRKREKWGFCTEDKKIVIPCTYESTNPFSEGLAMVQLREQCGYINQHGKLVLPCKYDFAGGFHNGIAVVSIKNKYGFIDKAGDMVIKAEYSFASEFSDGLAIVEQKGKFGFIDNTGKVIIPFRYTEVAPFKNGVSFVEYNGRDIFIDTAGNEIPEPENSGFYDGLAVDFSEEKEAFGYVNEKLEVVVPHIYQEANDFSEGLAAVCLKGKWGFIDTTGKLVVPCVYGDATFDFEDGLALVEVGDDFGYIDKNGTKYWE